MLDRWRQISLGDVQSNYLLTTAENELGVVVAHSESGKEAFRCTAAYDCKTLCEHTGVLFHFPKNVLRMCCRLNAVQLLCLRPLPSLFCVPGAQMVPISWCEMQCPLTHAKEFRKVARVQPEYLQA